MLYPEEEAETLSPLSARASNTFLFIMYCFCANTSSPLPGRTTDQYSAGCNRLINRNVASLVTSGDDIIKAMQWEPAPDAGRTARQRELFPELTDEEEPAYQFLKKHNGDPVHINTIYATLQIPMSQLLGLLIDLEFKGLVTALPGNRYSTIST